MENYRKLEKVGEGELSLLWLELAVGVELGEAPTADEQHSDNTRV